MATSFKLGQLQREDFEAIRDLDPEVLQAVVQRLRQLEEAPIPSDRLSSALTDTVGGRDEVADSIVRQALILNGWLKRESQTVDELLTSVRNSIRSEYVWDEENLERWQRNEPHFGELLSLPIVRFSASAIDLSYEYTNLLTGTRILTDIRPIFTDDARGIDGAVVSHSFRLQFRSIAGGHELVIAIDESDIKKLADQCDRALRKAQTARDLMRDDAGIPTMISGESKDA